jgi:transcription elongation factor Elf1
MTEEPQHWTDEAACIGLHEIYDSRKQEDRAFAKVICESCPVRFACLQDALDTKERHTFRGGVSEKELRVAQSINAEGKTHVHPNRRIRCLFCGPRSTKYLRVLERHRTKTHIECTNCGLTWFSRKLITRRLNF